MPPVSKEPVIPSERSEPRDLFDLAFGLAQDKLVRTEPAPFCPGPIDPSARSLRSLGRDDKKKGISCLVSKHQKVISITLL